MDLPSALEGYWHPELWKRYTYTHGHHLTSSLGKSTTANMSTTVFSVPIFFVIFRESFETGIIISVLLAFLKQTVGGAASNDLAIYKTLRKQVWVGSALALLICGIIGGGLIGAFYGLRKNGWAETEYYWEGTFSLVATILITIMGAALLRVSKMREKWQAKLEKEYQTQGQWYKRLFGGKYIMFWIPFVTVLREGIEALVFICGVSFTSPSGKAIPLPLFAGLAAGAAASYVIYRGGAGSKLQFFLIASTCLLYLIAAGLFSKCVWYFQAQMWNNAVGSDAAELGAGPGSYDVSKVVWHVNYGNPELNGGGGWGIFNAIFGWTNSATYGSVISYNLYWIVVIAMFFVMRFQEVRGHYPFMKAKVDNKHDEESGANSESSSRIFEHPGSDAKMNEKSVDNVHVAPARVLSE
jgi:high-affinity iron transporter